ncbi:TPA: type II toxin-antitoxin system HigB family toxin [Serratia marcescens]
MRLVGREKLEHLKDIDPSSRRWIDTWLSELSRAGWKSKKEIYEQFPKVINVSGDVYLFKVEGCDFYIEIMILFNHLLVLITSIKDNQNGY